MTLSLKSKLILTGSLEFLTNADTLLSLSSLLSLSCFFALLNVKLVSELLLEFFLSSSLLLLGGQFLEDLVTDGFGLHFHSLDLVLTSLLLLSISSDHLVLVLVHLSLAFQKCTLLVLRKNHISLRLLFLLLDDAGLLVVFLDHALDNSIDLLLLSQVLLMSLFSGDVGIINLLLN